MKLHLVPWEPTHFLKPHFDKILIFLTYFRKISKNFKFHENPSRPVGADPFF